MRRLIPLLLAIVVGCSVSPELQQDERLMPLTILHWNDFHAHNVPYRVTVRDSLTQNDTSYLVGGTATLLGYINRYRQAQRNVVVFNAGDDFQGTPISSITMGRSQIELMNIIEPTAMALGNHEFDYGISSLRENLRLARFPVLCANVFDTQTEQLLTAAVTIVDVGNIRMGVVGLIVPNLEIYVIRDSLRNIRMLDVDSVLQVHLRLFKSQDVNLVVVISHMGLEHDVPLAERHPEIDIIVGGHDHRALHQPLRVNRTLIVQAGSAGRWLGKLDLLVDIRGDSVYHYHGTLVETRVNDVEPDPVALAKVEELEARAGDAMREVIGQLTTPWIRTRGDRRADSNIGNWQADVMRSYARADVAFQNNGGIRADLPVGPITVGDVWRMSPFGNTFVVFEVTGAMLKKMIDFQTSVHPREACQVSGIRFTFDSSLPAGERLKEVSVNGKPISDSTVYRIVTNSYVFSNSDAHFGIARTLFKAEELPGVDRDVFIKAIREAGVISSIADGRIRDLATTEENRR